MKNEKQFVEDCANTLSAPSVMAGIILTVVIFAGFGMVFGFLYISQGLPILQGEIIAQLIIIGLDILTGIAVICALIIIYLCIYHNESILDYIIMMGRLLLFAIPGMITLLLCAAATVSDNELPFGYTACFLIVLSLIMTVLSFTLIRKKLQEDREIHQKKSLNTLRLGFVVVMLVLLAVKLLPIEHANMIGNLALLIMVVAFFSYLCGRFSLAAQIIDKFRTEFIRYETISYNAFLGKGNNVEQRRLFVYGMDRYETTQDILLEFGFSQELIQEALLHQQPLFTFVEGMRLDYHYLDQILRRLVYEDIRFEVEEWNQGQWQKMNADFYDYIDPADITRIKKSEYKAYGQPHEEAEKDENISTLAKRFGYLMIAIIIPIYLLWIMIFPINMYRPISWMKEESIRTCYDSFTRFDWRTFLHGLCILSIIGIFLITPSLQEWLVNRSDAGRIEVIYGAFGMVFLGECFIFPLYLRRMKRVLDKEEDHLHNYSRKAFVGYILLIGLRMLRIGSIATLLQLSVMLCAIEAAKFFITTWRYLRHRKEPAVDDFDDEYIFYERSDIPEEYDRYSAYDDEVFYHAYDPLTVYYNGDQYVAALNQGELRHDIFQNYAVEELDTGYGWEAIAKEVLYDDHELLDRIEFASETEYFQAVTKDQESMQCFLTKLFACVQDDQAFIDCILKLQDS